MEHQTARLHDAAPGDPATGSAARASTRPHSPEQTRQKPDVRLSARELVRGVARLVEGQRRLARELGLNDERVFLSDVEPFRNGDAKAVLRDWMLAGADGVDPIRNLFDDLCEHQLALLRAVDGVALSALEAHAPRGPMAWLHRAKDRLFGVSRLRALVEDDQARFQRIVAPALACSYARAREQDLNRRSAADEAQPSCRHTGDS
ncbi:hypothetical protein [Thioalkalivibrio denitrificans]|nr:hypothetical protein [Thioalkalivibrio denitrificans]